MFLLNDSILFDSMTPTKIVPYKNGTPCEKMLRGYLLRTKLSDF